MSASILVVDDEEAIVSSLSSILEDEGYEVSVAKSGTEALKTYMSDPPDLMLLDIWMPDMDGLETLRRIREIVPTAQVMVMSGHGSSKRRSKRSSSGRTTTLRSRSPWKTSPCGSSTLWNNTAWKKKTAHCAPRCSASSNWSGNLPRCSSSAS